MLKICWTGKTSNKKVIKMIHKNKEIIITVRKRQIYLFWLHNETPRKVQNNYSILFIDGKRSRGRQRLTWWLNLCTWMYRENLFEIVCNKKP